MFGWFNTSVLQGDVARHQICPGYENVGLRFFPSGIRNGAWNIVCFTDSDYAGDEVSRQSVSGYIIYVRAVPVMWRSKAQQSVTLSSTEAE